MKCLQKQRGSLLLIAIALILVVGLMATVFTSLYVGDTASSADHASASQALFAAESGIEHAFYTYSTGTACNALTYTNVVVGSGSFTTAGTLYQPIATSLNGAITAAATVIPVASTAGYAPHGRITIQAEQIDYAAIVGNSFSGARRGMNGTTAAAHANGQAVTQSQCLVRSTGAAGSARRVVEAGALPGAAVSSALFDTAASGAISNAAAGTNIGGNFAPVLPAGTNLLIGAVSLSNTTATAQNITGGNLRLRRSGALLSSNQFTIRLGGAAPPPPSTTTFARASMFLLHRQINVPANPVYTVNARTTGGGTTTGEAKLLVLNTPTAGNSDFRDLGAFNIATTPAGTNLINNVAFAVPAGDRLVIAAVQLYNNNAAVNQNRSIAAGALTLRKGPGNGPILASNQFAIDLSRSGDAHPGASLLLLARDPNGVVNQRYSVNAVATGGTNLQGEAKVIVLAVSGISAAVFDGGSVPVLNADTVVGSLPTTFAVGQHAVIAATQFINTANGVRNIPIGRERVVSGVLPTTVNEFNAGLCASAVIVPANAICDDFTSGLLWRNNAGTANPTFEVHAQADNLGINAETKIMAIGMNNGVSVIDWLEVFQ
jgi:hypothetical protein